MAVAPGDFKQKNVIASLSKKGSCSTFTSILKTTGGILHCLWTIPNHVHEDVHKKIKPFLDHFSNCFKPFQTAFGNLFGIVVGRFQI